MSDGTKVASGGTGDTIWTEDIGDVRGKIQRNKIALGGLDIDAGDLIAGQAVMANSLPVTLASNQTAVPTLSTAAGGGGATGFTLAATLASNNATLVKNSAGTLYGLEAFNLAAYPIWVKLFNKATAPVPGTDTPVRTVMVPASGSTGGAGVVINFGAVGLAFTTGIGYAITKNQPALDNTSVAAGDGTLNGHYA